MGSKKKVTIGYRYYMGIHMGLGRGPINELVEIQVGDKTAWSGSAAGNQSITIDKPGLFGGDKKEGGIQGSLDVLMGGPTQTAPARLASMLGGDVPGFRGVVTLFYDGLVSAMNPYIKPWKFRVRRSTAGWDGEAWYPVKAKIELSAGAIHAMNPAHIIFECLTNRDWGAGMDRSRLDDASFRAAANALYAEGFGLCLRWNRGGSVSDFVQEVLDHIGGNLYLSRFDGTFHLSLIRDDYDAASLPLFDEDTGLLGVDEDDNSASSGALNELVVKWHDPISNQSRSWRERNLGAVQADGQVLSESKSYSGLPTVELAGRVAVRELRVVSAGLKRVKVRLDRRGYAIEPGQPFRIRSLKRGIETMVVRAGRIEDGTLSDATITITAVQDVFGLPASSMAAVQPSGWVPPDSTPQAVTLRRLMEQTWRDLAQSTDPANLALVDQSACRLTGLAVKPTSLSQGYVMETRVGAAAFMAQDDDSFCPSGLLVSALGPTDTAFTLASGSDLDFVEVGGAALLGDEIVRVDSFDPVSLSGTLGRGCVDTVPASHAAGTRLWFYDDAVAVDPTEYAPSTTVQARLLTQTSKGQLDPALAAIDSLTLAQRQGRPYPPGQVLIDGAAYPESVEGNVRISWAHRDRLLQADQLIDAGQGSIGPETGTTYSVRLLRDDTQAELVKQTGIPGNEVSLSTSFAGEIALELWAVRDDLESLARVRHTFTHLVPYDEQVGTIWNLRAAPIKRWSALSWSPELGLFVALSNEGAGNRAMSSPDGINWTLRITPAPDYSWRSVCWAGGLGLFVGVALDGGLAMSSPDGINWTLASGTLGGSPKSVCWSPAIGRLVSVSSSTGVPSNIVISDDGNTWTGVGTASTARVWNDVCWSPALGLFAAVASSGTGSRAATSPDGINWTVRTTPADNDWGSVCWSPELGLFVAVAFSGTGNRAMTSPDGINWTLRSTPADSYWTRVCWTGTRGLFVAVAGSGTGNRVMTSPDGINWALQATPADLGWTCVAWSPQLGRVVATAAYASDNGNRVMTSP